MSTETGAEAARLLNVRTSMTDVAEDIRAMNDDQKQGCMKIAKRRSCDHAGPIALKQKQAERRRWKLSNANAKVSSRAGVSMCALVPSWPRRHEDTH